MIHRHSIGVDVERVKESLDISRDLLESLLPLATDANTLDTIAQQAMSVVQLCSVVDPSSPLISSTLQIAAQASAALHRKALAGKKQISFLLGSSTLELGGTLDESLIYSGSWLSAYFYNLLCRQTDQLQQLCDFPSRKLRGSTTQSSKIRHGLVPLLQAFYNDPTKCSRLGKQLLALPKARGIAEKWNNFIGKPIVDIVCRLATGDMSALDDSFANAVSSHHKFWSSTAKLRSDPDGFLAIELCALAGAAVDRGCVVSVNSDYLPPSIYTETDRRSP